MTRFIYLLTALCCVECYKILCLLPYPGKSHYLVIEPLLDELVNRGHLLTVVSFFPSSNSHPNRRDVSLVGMSPLNFEVIDLSNIDHTAYLLHQLYVQWEINKGIANLNLQLCRKLMNSDIFEEFVLGRGDYDVILVEHFNSDCMLGLIHNYGIPSVGLSTCTVMPWTPSRMGAPTNPSYVPLLMLPLTDEMTFLERLLNTISTVVVDGWFRMLRWEEQRILETRYGRKLPPLEDVGKNTSVVLVNTHHTLNGVRVMPPAYVEVGGMHLHNKTVKPLPERINKWVSESKDGFIIISFGSLVRGSTLPRKRLDAILKVISELPQRFIWKWESEQMDDLPPNVLLTKWLPQYDLLHHPKCIAFVTHGGLLSLTEAMSAGIPTFIISILGDQFTNAVHANRAYGAPYSTMVQVTEDSFREGIRKVLDPSLRARAKLQSEKWLDRPQPPMETAVFYIEQTAKYGGLNMSSHSRHLTWVQITLIDVIAFIVLVLVCVLVIMYYVCRKFTKITKVKVH